jgi:hypothetical protein
VVDNNKRADLGISANISMDANASADANFRAFSNAASGCEHNQVADHGAALDTDWFDDYVPIREAHICANRGLIR